MRVELRRLHMKAAEMAAAEGSPWRPSPACTPQRSALSELTSDSDLLSGKYKAEIARLSICSRSIERGGPSLSAGPGGVVQVASGGTFRLEPRGDEKQCVCECGA